MILKEFIKKYSTILSNGNVWFEKDWMEFENQNIPFTHFQTKHHLYQMWFNKFFIQGTLRSIGFHKLVLYF